MTDNFFLGLNRRDFPVEESSALLKGVYTIQEMFWHSKLLHVIDVT